MLLLYLLHLILILLLALLSQRSVTHPAMPQVACIADSVYCNVFTIFTLSFSFSYLNTSSSPAEGLGSHVGWYEVILAHSSWPAQKVRQTMGHAGCCVACPLLCCYTAFQKENRELVPEVSTQQKYVSKGYYAWQRFLYSRRSRLAVQPSICNFYVDSLQTLKDVHDSQVSGSIYKR